MKKAAIIAAAIVAVVAPPTWYFGSPYLAMRDLKEAVREGDRDDLAEKVDFPAVRESIKSQAKAVVMAEVAKQQDSNPFAALGSMVGMAMVDHLVDGIVSADGLRAMINKGKIRPQADAEVSAAPEAKWTITHKGIGRFTARPETAGGPAPELVFKRDDLGWKLVDVVLPAAGVGEN
ncbi:hypothetical protein FHW96_002845 [Novosphingobium sp. SG751A]|uniref:DUF2939 domain-containing protein n=1 Tax=Novosphingobium sp. SG751A TaxID=2587000 RepID=UPI001553D301|nr:hypothetical protein [Novosphingobium sp. SG751A]